MRIFDLGSGLSGCHLFLAEATQGRESEVLHPKPGVGSPQLRTCWSPSTGEWPLAASAFSCSLSISPWGSLARPEPAGTAMSSYSPWRVGVCVTMTRGAAGPTPVALFRGEVAQTRSLRPWSSPSFLQGQPSPARSPRAAQSSVRARCPVVSLCQGHRVRKPQLFVLETREPGLPSSLLCSSWLWIGLCAHSRWLSDEAQIHPVFGENTLQHEGLLFQSDKVFYFWLEKRVSVRRKGKEIIGKREEQKQSILDLRDGLGEFSIM